jgi:hypothetical protein
MKIGDGGGCGEFFPGPTLGGTKISDTIVNVCVAPEKSESPKSPNFMVLNTVTQLAAGMVNRSLIDKLSQPQEATSTPSLSGRTGFRQALMDVIVPKLFAFKPDFILISAGLMHLLLTFDCSVVFIMRAIVWQGLMV